MNKQYTGRKKPHTCRRWTRHMSASFRDRREGALPLLYLSNYNVKWHNVTGVTTNSAKGSNHCVGRNDRVVVNIAVISNFTSFVLGVRRHCTSFLQAHNSFQSTHYRQYEGRATLCFHRPQLPFLHMYAGFYV